MAEDHALMLIIAVGLTAVFIILLHDIPLPEKAPNAPSRPRPRGDPFPPRPRPEGRIAPSCSYCGTPILPGKAQTSCLGCGAPITAIRKKSDVPPPGPESIIIRSTPVNERLIYTVKR